MEKGNKAQSREEEPVRNGARSPRQHQHGNKDIGAKARPGNPTTHRRRK